MSVIRVLPAEIAGRIAAGEVIERPASVVKELVENSIDAGATRIRVQIEQGGQRLIQVTDNGCGMDRQDALMCLEAHATSKMTRDGDVGQISTLGFRGEAIPSVASVSHFQLQTRRHDDDVGTEVLVDNGVVRDVTDCGCAPGTNIRVGHLFGNLPARRKFMKGPDTEDGHIEEMMLMLALARPDIAFTLSLGGREVLKTTATTDIGARVRMVLGKDAFDAMLPVDYEEDGIRVRGFVSKPGYTRSSRHEQRMIINGRAAAAETLYFAIREAYDTLVLKGRYPGTVLYLDMAPDRVDVNVHPAKREVRFRDPRQVGAIVAAAIRTALRQMPGMSVNLSESMAGGHVPQPFTPQPCQPSLGLDSSSSAMKTVAPSQRSSERGGTGCERPSVSPGTKPRTVFADGIPAAPPVSASGIPSAPPVSASGIPSAPPVSASGIPAAPPVSASGIPAAPPVSASGIPAAPPVSASGIPAAPPVSAEMNPSAPLPSSCLSSKRPEFEPMQPSLPSLQVPQLTSQQMPGEGIAARRAAEEPSPAVPPRPPRGGLSLRVQGRLGSRYVLAETPGGLAVVDIRAAHQRILFEKLLRNLEDQKVLRQQLLLPVTLNLNQADARLMNSQLKEFDAIGFSIEPFGGQSFIVTAVPANFPNQDLVKALRDILEELRQDRSAKVPNALHLAQMACRHAVSAKDNPTDEEIRRLLADLGAAQMPYADPAGNPTMVHITYAELDKRFNHGGR